MKTLIHRTVFGAVLLLFAYTTFAQSQQIRGVQNSLTATFTSGSGTAYTAGDTVGSSQVLTNVADATGRIVELEAVTLKDSAGQNSGLKLLFFDGSAPSVTDNVAFAFGSSLPNLIGVLDIDSSDYATINSKGILSRSFLDLKMRLSNTSQNLTVIAVTTGTPTYGNGGTVSVIFHFKY